MTATTVFYLQYYGKMIEAKLAYTTNSQQLHKVIVMRVLRDIYQSRNSSILRSNSPMSQLFSSPDWVKQKTIKIGICCFSAKHATLRRKNKDWMALNQDNLSEWSDMSIHCCFSELELYICNYACWSNEHWKLTCSRHAIAKNNCWVGAKQSLTLLVAEMYSCYVPQVVGWGN